MQIVINDDIVANIPDKRDVNFKVLRNIFREPKLQVIINGNVGDVIVPDGDVIINGSCNNVRCQRGVVKAETINGRVAVGRGDIIRLFVNEDEKDKYFEL